MLLLKLWKMVQGRKFRPSSDCQTCMLETEGSYSKSCKRSQAKGNSFFPGPFGKNIAEETDQIQKLIAERKKGNTAYFIMDKLVVHDRKDKS